jgi:creatinine amidohydrolase
VTAQRRPVTAARRWADRPGPELTFSAGDVGLVPVGATEQHGPHLPTGTDTAIASAVCEGASALCGAVVLPAIPVGCSYGHGRELTGTLSLSPFELAGIVRAYADWAATSGLGRLVFLNAHLGNTAALGVGTDELRLHRPDLRAGVVAWWDLTGDLHDAMFAEGPDVHGNRAETAMMLHLAPEQVRMDLAVDDEDRSAGLVFRYTVPALARRGVTGQPSRATPELGARLVTDAAAALAALVARAETEAPPLQQ